MRKDTPFHSVRARMPFLMMIVMFAAVCVLSAGAQSAGAQEATEFMYQESGSRDQTAPPSGQDSPDRDRETLGDASMVANGMAAADGAWESVEEPAMRPYKGFFRGLKAFGHQTVKALAEGNEKLPIFGSVEIFRGLRRGSVELMSSTFSGMAGSTPKDHTQLSKPNRVIEDDPLLKHSADTAAATVVFLPGTEVEDAVAAGLGVLAVQKVTDHSPVAPEDEEEKPDGVMGEIAEDVKKEPKDWRDAQASYIGDRAHINRGEEGRGNLLKLAK